MGIRRFSNLNLLRAFDARSNKFDRKEVQEIGLDSCIRCFAVSRSNPAVPNAKTPTCDHCGKIPPHGLVECPISRCVPDTDCLPARFAQRKQVVPRTTNLKPNLPWRFPMSRFLVPAVLALAVVACNVQEASAFGHLKSLFGGCDSGCDVACEPTCGCEPICEPVCGCEVVEPCCAPKQGLLQRLFAKKHGCDACCEPVCEPVCGCEPVCEPVCGCEVVDPCCDSAPCCDRPVMGLFKKLFSRKNACCDSGCDIVEPTCGCEYIEPSCGFEAPACGCGH